MKASELLKQLNELINKHGDLEVMVRFDSYCHDECCGVEYKEGDKKSGEETGYQEDYFLI